jgi:hypothetical protein
MNQLFTVSNASPYDILPFTEDSVHATIAHNEVQKTSSDSNA